MDRPPCRVTMEGKMFVLLSVPEVDDLEDYLTDYLEDLLDIKVNCLGLNPLVPNRVLVTMTEMIGLAQVRRKLAENPFEGQTLAVESPDFGNALIVKTPDLLREDAPKFLKSYFKNNYADGEEAALSCFQLPQSEMSVFCFSDSEVVEKVLECKRHCVAFLQEKYEVLVEAFFHNFHGCIPINDKLLNDILEEERIGSPTGNLDLQHHWLDENDNVPKGQSEVADVPNYVGNSLNLCYFSTGMSEMDGGYAHPYAVFHKALEPQKDYSEKWLQSFKISLQDDEAVVSYDEAADVLLYRMSETEWNLLHSRIDFKSVKLEYDCDKALLVIRGGNIRAFLKYLKELQALIYYKTVTVDKETENLMASHYAKEYLTSHFPDVQWHFQDGYLHIYAFNMSAVEEFKNKIGHLKNDFDEAAPENKLSEEDQTMLETCPSMYKSCSAGRISLVQISSNANETTICGLQKHSIGTIGKLKSCRFGDDNMGAKSRWSDVETVLRTSLEFSDFYFKFLCTHHKDEFDQALKCVTSSINSKCGKVFIELSGDRKGIKRACDIVKTIVHSIEIELKMCLAYFAQSDVV